VAERFPEQDRTSRVPEASTDDAHWVALAREGDQEAFQRLTEPYLVALESVLRSIVRDRDRAQDLVQETVLRTWRNLSLYKDEFRFSTWLFRIGSNLAISHLRRAGLEARYLRENAGGAVDATSPLDALILEEDKGRLHRALLALPARQREVMKMRYGEELAVQEIAQRLDTTPNTISILLFRAKARLKEELERK
jgi:RNA polymerase sigma-70 factor (ECF subfamily)